MSVHARLSELRALMTADPSASAWQNLINALDVWPNDKSLELALDYAEQHLSHWPDRLRWAPWPWWDNARHGRPGPRWRLVRTLGLEGFGKTQTVLSDLEQCAHLQAITTLDMGHMRLNSHHLKQIARNARLSNLRELDLSHNLIGDDEALWYHLKYSEPLQQLTHLHMRANPLGEPGGVAVARSRFAPHLEGVNLRETGLGPQSMEALAAGLGPELRTLELSGNPAIRDDGIQALAQTSTALGITALHLNNCNLGPKGLEALLKAPMLQSVVWLDLCGNSIGVKGARLLGQRLGKLPSLKRLSLMSSRMGPQGAVALADSPHLGGLEQLDVRFRDIGREGARALAQAPALNNTVRAAWSWA
ncbi:MAG: hypothetical protein AAFS10_21795 [Myxococcota bacterium]